MDFILDFNSTPKIPSHLYPNIPEFASFLTEIHSGSKQNKE